MFDTPYTMNQYTKPLEYEVNIDFDEASTAWMANKTRLAGAHYKYICGSPTKKGSRCLNPPSCKVHAAARAKLESNDKRKIETPD